MFYVIGIDGYPVGNPNAKLNPFTTGLAWHDFIYIKFNDTDAAIHLHLHQLNRVAVELDVPPDPTVKIADSVLIDAWNVGVVLIRLSMYELKVDQITLEGQLKEKAAELNLIEPEVASACYADAWNTRLQIQKDYPKITELPEYVVDEAVIRKEIEIDSPYPGDL